MDKNKKLFNKHYVKRDPSNQKLMFDEKGNGIPGDFIRDVPLLPQMADELNEQSENHGYVWVLAKESEPVEKSEKRLQLEAEAKELGISFRDNIGDDKLQEKINKELEK